VQESVNTSHYGVFPPKASNWITLKYPSDWSWCGVNEEHKYFVCHWSVFNLAKPYMSNIVYGCTIGDILFVDFVPYEVCKIEFLDMTDGKWVMVYAHPRGDFEPMEEEEWQELYGSDVRTADNLDSSG